jgi:hypothetical protein
MTTRHSLILAASIIACPLAYGSLFGQAPAAPVKPPPQVGRFMILDRRPETQPMFILFDNATGHIWERHMTKTTPPRWEWRDIGCPPEGLPTGGPQLPTN